MRIQNTHRFKPSTKSALYAGLISSLCAIWGGLDSIFFIPQIFLSTAALLYLFFRETDNNGTLFHPVPLVSLALIWSFSLSPVASVTWGSYVYLPPKEIDWPTWMIYTSIIYTICAILFSAGVLSAEKTKIKTKTNNYLTTTSKQTLKAIAPFFLVSALAAQIYIFSKFGGLTGYLITWTEEKEAFNGLGSLFMIAEAFPIMLFITFTMLIDPKRISKNMWLLAFSLISFIALKLLFGGLRGSRSNTIWGVFWVIGIIHLKYFRLKLHHYIIGLALLFGFMTTYSIYKTFGIDSFSGEYSIEDTNRFNESPIKEMLLGDFSRAGVNSYILHEYMNTDYNVKLGATYFNSIFKIVPFVDSPFGAHTKDSASAELFYGLTVDPILSDIHNSRIFGLYGEGLINFGAILPVLLFFAAGHLIGRLNSALKLIPQNDPRTLLTPFISTCCLMLLLMDSDNLIFFIFKNGFLACMLVFITIKKIKPPTILPKKHESIYIP